MMCRPSFRESCPVSGRLRNRVGCRGKSSGERAFPESGEVWEFLHQWFDILVCRGILRIVLGKVASIGAAIADVPDSVDGASRIDKTVCVGVPACQTQYNEERFEMLRTMLSVAAVAIALASAQSADAGLFFRSKDHGCAAPAPSCAAPAPVCEATPCCEVKVKKVKHRKVRNNCCEVAPSCAAPVTCAAPAPTCCAPVAPSCCAPAPTCCAPVAPSCAAPAAGHHAAPAAPAAAPAEAPAPPTEDAPPKPQA